MTYYFHPEIRDERSINMNMFFGFSGLHSILFRYNALIMHASFFIYEGKAILFTAPSQNGKSTQAALWQKYEGAEIINGDRALLREIDGIWYVFGYPCCGSSNICKNKAAPLKTIVVLVQGQENQMISLTTGEKIRGIVSATELYVWNKKEVDVAFELAQQLSEQVPIVKLSCTPDKDAVECLKKYLEENA